MKRPLVLAGLLVLIALGLSAGGRSGESTPGQVSAAANRIYENARLVLLDTRARTITVRGGAIGKETTFAVDPPALHGAAALKAGDQVIHTVRAIDAAGTEVVTQIERSLGTPRVRGRRRPAPSTAEASPGDDRTSPPAFAAASPAPTPLPSPPPSRPGSDTVGPLSDPRVAPLADPRQDPLRDPRVIPGLSEPAPSPSPPPSSDSARPL